VSELAPARPWDERYMHGWYLVAFKGDYRKAKAAAKEHVAKHLKENK
jgi:hypothetical protein